MFKCMKNYDLKGSTYKRLANHEERQKESPTWKDLDFMKFHPKGLILDTDTFNALQKTVQRDCRVRLIKYINFLFFKMIYYFFRY